MSESSIGSATIGTSGVTGGSGTVGPTTSGQLRGVPGASLSTKVSGLTVPVRPAAPAASTNSAIACLGVISAGVTKVKVGACRATSAENTTFLHVKLDSQVARSTIVASGLNDTCSFIPVGATLHA